MKQKLSIVFTALIATVLLILVPTNLSNVDAASQDVSYKIVEAGKDSVSIADGYFVKPAKYTEENGKNYVELTLREAQYIKALSGPYGAVQVLSDDGSKRVVKMQVGDLSKPVALDMHIVVPEEIAGMVYDNQHKARAIFDASGIKSGGSSESTVGSGVDKEENPRTSDQTPLALYSVLILGSGAVLFFIWKRRATSNWFLIHKGVLIEWKIIHG